MKVAADAARLRAAGRDVVDLGPGEPDFPTPENIKRAAVRAIEEDFTRYTAAGGADELKRAICRRHAEDFGTGFTPAECTVSAGGKHALFNVIQSLVDPGDEVIVPAPYWVTFRDISVYSGGRPVIVETSGQEGFAITAGLLERSVTPRTRAIIVNSPCNPTGEVIPRAEWGRIVEMAAARGIWIITDECYSHLVYDGEPFSAAALDPGRETVIVAGSLSKMYAMTGWRMGYVLGPPEVAAAAAKLQSQSTSNPNSIAQKAAVEALTGSQEFRAAMLAEYRRRRDLALARLRAIPGVRCHTPKGAFYLYPNVRDGMGRIGVPDTVALATRLLNEAGVAVVPGEAFGTTDHLRITFAVSAAELERGLDRLERFFLGRSS
jgi:aspartate aminotransferase